MDTLNLNDNGPDVVKLQQALATRGFPPGTIDGTFGAGTEAALIGFQKSANLLPDGKAGPRTLAALGLVDNADLPTAIPHVTVQVVSKMFPSTPLGNIKRHLPTVVDALVARHLSDKPMVLMALATIRAETEGFVPIDEGLSRFNTSPGGQAFDLYDMRTDIGNRGKPDGERYKGRGFIQLTGRANYRRFGPKLSQPFDLEANPDRANDPAVAAELLALFIGDKERQIKQALNEGDLRHARRLVNGGSHGLDQFTAAFTTGDALIPDA